MPKLNLDVDEFMWEFDAAEPEGGRLGFVPSTGTLGDAKLLLMADATLEPLRGCLLPLACEVESLPEVGVSGFVADLAARYGVENKRTDLAEWGSSVANVLGDQVELDKTELLLIGLKKVGAIDGRQASRLLTNHGRERKTAAN